VDNWYSVKKVSELMDCSPDTARARMKEMPGVINVGSAKRRQLMVPEYGLEDWLRNHRIMTVRIEMPKMKLRKDGKIARIDRRTGRLQAV
jgi:hypothetical protein